MMNRKVISSPAAPAAGGPYSHAIVANGFVFTAGQVGLDPATGQLAEGGIEAQTRQALQNVKSVLESAGTTLDNVVKVNVYLKNMDDFAKMNEVYSTFFYQSPPARTTVEVARLPIGALIEIETVALLP